MIVVAFLVALGATFFFWRLWRRRVNAKLARLPFAGLDTGVRSPYRVPGRLFAHRRGF